MQLMPNIWFQYLRQKFSYASLVALQKCNAPDVATEILWLTMLKHALQDPMTYLFKSKGVEMSPSISAQETLVVRKLPRPDAGFKKLCEQINVGDVIVMKDPLDSDKHLVRRLAALGGYEMASTEKEDESFVLEDGQCWVLSDNKHLKPKECKDSRTFGPISTADIVGRAIYRYRTREDHGYMVNNRLSMSRDMPVIYAEVPYMNFGDHSAEKNQESKGSQS